MDLPYLSYPSYNFFLDIRKSVYNIFWFGIKNEVTDIVPVLKEATVKFFLIYN